MIFLKILQTMPHNDNVKDVCLKSLLIKNKKKSQVFTGSTLIELGCLLFPLTILEMFLQLDLSPPVVNSVGWTRTHLSI